MLDSIVAKGAWVFLAFIWKAKKKYPKNPVDPVIKKRVLLLKLPFYDEPRI